MTRNQDPFLKRLSSKLTDEQVCQMVAMRDVLGIEAAANHFGISKSTVNDLNKKVKTRPDLDQVYWQYRRKMARGWIESVGEVICACSSKIKEEFNANEPNLQLINLAIKAAEVFGDIAVSSMALAEEINSEPTAAYESLEGGDEEEEGDGEPYVLVEAVDAG